MVARYGHSAQLWSSDIVVTVDFTASTSGKTYTPSATIYDRGTHQVIAFNPNAAHHSYSEGTLPGVDPPVRFGDHLNLGITYSPATGHLDMWAENPLWGSYGRDFWTTWSYTVTAQSFSKAKIGTDFGSSPWDASYSYTPPADPVNLAAYTGVSLTSYSGHKADLTSWWVCHKLLAQPSSRGLVAIPHGLTGGGASFQTWFVPKSAQGAS